MPLTSELQPWYIKQMPGMNTKVEDLELEDGNKNVQFASIAQNVRFHNEPGTFDKRDPFSYYNGSSLGSGPMLGGTRFYTSAGTIKTVVAHGNQIYVGNDSNGTFTSIRTLGTSGKRCTFLTYKDLLHGFTGYDNNFVYDGADDVTWEQGACKAITGGGTGITKTSVSYAVTMDSDAYVNGAVSNTIASLSNQSVSLTHIPTGPVGTTNRKIYRKDSSTGGAYKLVTTIANNTATTYTDTTADVSGAASMPAVTDDMPMCAIARLCRERIFMTMDPNNPNRIYYTGAYLPWYIQQTTNLDYMEITPEDGDVIVGIPLRLGNMVCVKKNSVRNLHITSAQSGADPATWWADDPISNVGSPAPYSIFETPDAVVFLGWDRWQKFDGVSVTPYINEFDSAGVLKANYHDVVAKYLNTGVILAGYTDAEGVNQYNDRVMRYDLPTAKLSYDTIAVNCIFTQSGDGESGELFYGLASAGYVIKADQSDLTYRLQGKTACNLGTNYGTYVGGTEAAPYIQIGSVSSASAIPDNICIFWDDADENPGVGWTEVTGFDGKFLKISTSAVGTTGTVGETTGGDESNLSYLTYKLYKKNNSTTEYTFPIGAIVMWDQPFDPTGYQEVAEGNYIQLGDPGSGTFVAHTDTGAGGTSIDNTLALRFIKKIGEEDTWDGVANYVYAVLYDSSTSNGWTDVASSYSGKFLLTSSDGPTTVDGGATDSNFNFINLSTTTHIYESGNNGANSIDGNTSTYQSNSGSGGGGAGGTAVCYSEHIFETPQTITSIYWKAAAQASSSGPYSNEHRTQLILQYKTDGASSYTDIVDQNSGNGSNGSQSISRDETQTVSLSNVIAIKVTAFAGGSNSGSGSWSGASQIYEIQAGGKFGFVTARIAKKVLGKMQDYNAALESAATNGVWVSPSLQINAETLGKLYWNETTSGTDDIELYIRTGSTSAAVTDGVSVTADNTTETFTAVAHGMSNTNRVQILGTLPTGISSGIIYYVVNKTDDTFQVSLTSGGSAVAFSTDGSGLTFKLWSDAYETSNGQTITNAANTWLQYCVGFVAADTTVDNPTVLTADGFVVKFTYSQGAASQESSVEMIYELGFRNFADPMADKIFRKITSIHDGTAGGQLIVTWTTDIGETGTFTIDLSANPKRWESFFHENAFGRHLKIRLYKNDLLSFKMKEISGIYSAEPIII